MNWARVAAASLHLKTITRTFLASFAGFLRSNWQLCSRYGQTCAEQADPFSKIAWRPSVAVCDKDVLSDALASGAADVAKTIKPAIAAAVTTVPIDLSILRPTSHRRLIQTKNVKKRQTFHERQKLVTSESLSNHLAKYRDHCGFPGDGAKSSNTSRPVTSSPSMNAPHHHDVPGLTGLRFLAAFCVLFAHCFAVLMRRHETTSDIIFWLMTPAYFGMTLFFVLSGFVIHYNYARLVTNGRFTGIATFWWARFARLYPLLVLTLFLSALLSFRPLHFLAGDREAVYTTLQALPYFLLSIQSWIYLPIGENSLIYTIAGSGSLTWSISTEWFFYLLYPCIAWLVLLARRPSITALFVLAWCAIWISFSSGLYDRAPQIDAWGIAHFGPIADMQQHYQDSFVRWLLYFSPYLRMGEFVLGAIVAQLYVQLQGMKVTSRENSIGTSVFAFAAASVFLITYLGHSENIGENIFHKMSLNFALGPSAAALIFCAARYRNVATRLLMSSPALLLGDASYSIYLLHFNALVLVAWLTESATHSIAFDAITLVVAMLIILLSSVALYRYFERPARNWLRKHWRQATAGAVQLR